MDESQRLLVGLAAIFVLGIGGQWLAWRLRVPSILILLAMGFLAGPVTGWIDPDAMLGPLLFPVVSLSLAMILFEGGLSLRIAELREIGVALGMLLSVGVLVTWALGTLAAWWLLGFEWRLALLLGAILTVTGPTVVGPLLLHIRPVGRVGAIAKWEGIVIDPIGVVLAVLVFEAVTTTAPQHTAGTTLVNLAATIIVGTSIGLAAVMILIVALRRYWIPDGLQSPVALLLVVAAMTASNLLQHESGLLAVTLMGIVLVNQRDVEVRHIIEFKENLRVLLISALFVLLAARVGFDDLGALGWGSLAFVAAMVLVVRPMSVFVSTIGRKLTWQERSFLAWLAPRGIVAAVAASVFGLRMEDGGELLFPATFVMIACTVTIYGLTAEPVARWLGLSSANPQGMLIAGAHPLARAIAAALKGQGQRVLLVDMNRWNIREARMQGLPCYYGNVLSEQAMEDVNLGGIGRLLALTPNDEVNSLAAMHYAELFGRAEVYQLPREKQPSGRIETARHHLRGRLLFSETATYEELTRRLAAGAKIKINKLTAEFDYANYRALYGPDALPLCTITEAGRLVIYTADTPPSPKRGQILISLVEPLEDRPDTEPQRTEADGAAAGGLNRPGQTATE